jgi:hypothetical protein
MVGSDENFLRRFAPPSTPLESAQDALSIHPVSFCFRAVLTFLWLSQVSENCALAYVRLALRTCIKIAEVQQRF